METIAIISLANGSFHKITEEIYNQFLEAGDNDYLTLSNGAMFKKSAVMEITAVDEWEKQHPEKVFNDYHQPYIGLPAPKTYQQIINSASKTSHLEAFAKGIKKVIEARKKQGLESKNCEKFLDLARIKYLALQK